LNGKCAGNPIIVIGSVQSQWGKTTHDDWDATQMSHLIRPDHIQITHKYIIVR
tara:strand:- start:23 stop:181 length:159 start_codon:yes stop_codon:yes gene_type:complete